MGKPQLGRRDRAERVVLGVVDRRPLELELGVARGDVAPAPADHRPADVEPGVGAAVEAAGQRDRHPADPATDVEHPVGGLEAAELDEVVEELAAGWKKSPSPTKESPRGGTSSPPPPRSLRSRSEGAKRTRRASAFAR